MVSVSVFGPALVGLKVTSNVPVLAGAIGKPWRLETVKCVPVVSAVVRLADAMASLPALVMVTVCVTESGVFQRTLPYEPGVVTEIAGAIDVPSTVNDVLDEPFTSIVQVGITPRVLAEAV